MRRWVLVVDESGNFADESSAVAGVLLTEACWLEVNRQLPRLVEKHLPEVPWPPHAALLRRSAAWWLWDRAAGRIPEHDPAWDHLSEAGRAKVIAQIERIRSRREPVFERLRELEGEWSRGTASPAGRMRERMKAGLGGFSRIASATLRDAVQRGECWICSSADEPAIDGSLDPYLDALEALTARARTLVEARAEEAQLNVLPLRRPVRDRILGPGTPIPMARSHVAEVVRRVEERGGWLRYGNRPMVTLAPMPPEDYGPGATGAAVLADWVANNLRPVMGYARSLRPIAQALGTLVEGHPPTGPGGVPTLTSSGEVDMWVDENRVARRGNRPRVASEAPEAARAWVREQGGIAVDAQWRNP